MVVISLTNSSKIDPETNWTVTAVKWRRNTNMILTTLSVTSNDSYRFKDSLITSYLIFWLSLCELGNIHSDVMTTIASRIFTL